MNVGVSRKTVGVVAAAALVLLAPRDAAAQSWQGQTLCATSNLSVCASVTVVQSGNQLTVTVTNTGSAGTLFTIGLFYTTPPAWSGTYRLASVTKNGTDVTGQWRTGTQSLNATLDWGVRNQGQAAHGVQVGDQVVFVINFTPGFNVDASTGLAWHAGQLRVSEKCITGEVGEHGCTVVPEPISMVLLGTGLAGLGGIGALRRRRKGVDVVSG